MKRRTRLRKLGLLVDPPEKLQHLNPARRAIAQQLLKVFRREGDLPAERQHQLATDFCVLDDADMYGAEPTARLLIKYGVLPSQLREIIQWRL